jgi:serine/threonine protein kinase
MGKVYLAAHNANGEQVAIKVLPPKRVQDEERTLARFLREKDLSMRVTHPNLARTLAVGHEGNVHFIVLEYIAGESLYDTVKGINGGALRVPDAARLFLKVVDGLEAAHDAGLVHRDIKPSNIMITPDGDAKILDLGLARARGDDRPLTAANIVVGTLDYASPEQLVNAAAADQRSDLYSLGCTLYFTLAGRPPFDGGDMVNKMFKQRMEDPEPLERAARGVPPAFAAVVRKLMAKAPEERYGSCAELRADLARWADPETVRAIVGKAAESARAFHPPVNSLEDDDLRLLPDDVPGGPGLSLRELGDAEPSAAPYRHPVPPPLPAKVLPAGERPRPFSTETSPQPEIRSRWTTQSVAALVVLALVVVLLWLLFS